MKERKPKIWIKFFALGAWLKKLSKILKNKYFITWVCTEITNFENKLMKIWENKVEQDTGVSRHDDEDCPLLSSEANTFW